MSLMAKLKRILWAEDDSDLHLLIQTVFMSQSFCQLSFAHSATEALMKYKQAKADGEPFDLIALDIAMPDHSGLWVAKKIRESGDWQTPIVFCTAHNVVYNRQEAQEVAAIGWIVKPFGNEDLIKAIGAALAE